MGVSLKNKRSVNKQKKANF